tara:strand:- start:405 stop:602 length:198 start_codon:yes stop_codon:yes gene_type:complete
MFAAVMLIVFMVAMFGLLNVSVDESEFETRKTLASSYYYEDDPYPDTPQDDEDNRSKPTPKRETI